MMMQMSAALICWMITPTAPKMITKVLAKSTDSDRPEKKKKKEKEKEKEDNQNKMMMLGKKKQRKKIWHTPTNR